MLATEKRAPAHEETRISFRIHVVMSEVFLTFMPRLMLTAKGAFCAIMRRFRTVCLAQTAAWEKSFHRSPAEQ